MSAKEGRYSSGQQDQSVPDTTQRLVASARETLSKAASPKARSMANQARLQAAVTHLIKCFEEAESELIDGRPFYGEIIIAIPFQAGAAQHIKASKIATDRVGG